MPKRKSNSPVPFGDFADDFEDETCSEDSKTHPPVQRNAANARERARMRVLSSAFCRLKTKLPWVPSDTKLSKLDTLRLATIYIQQLRASVTTGGAINVPHLMASASSGAQHNSSAESGGSTTSSERSGPPHGPSMVWPFSFAQQSINESRYGAGASATTTTTTTTTGLTHWLSATARLGAPAAAAVTTTNCSTNDHHRS